MTNPPGPPHDDTSPWARPSGPTQPAQPGPGQSRSDAPTGQTPEPDSGPATRTVPGPKSAAEPPAGKPTHGRFGFLRDPLSIFLVVVIVVALAAAGLIGGELVGRHIADGKVAKATECEVEDGVNVSFGAAPPFLWQHLTGHYTNISIRTAGNQIKDAQDMQADLKIADVRLRGGGQAAGTIGSLDAAVTWSAEGIKKTVRGMIPLFGNLVSDVRTHPDDGTVELTGAFGLGGTTVRPQVKNNTLSLEVVSLSGLAGLAGGLTKENVQAALDDFSKHLTSKYPLGIQPDSIDVTDSGVSAKLSAHDAAIPKMDNPCFADL